MKKTVGMLVLFGVLAVLAVAQAEQEKKASPKEAIAWSASEIKWSENPAMKGAKIAVLWGDPKTSGYGSLKSLPAGSALSLHTHTEDQRVIVVSGTILLSLDGGAAREFGPGSYAFIPGGMKHKAECKPGADCIYFEEQAGPADIHFIEQTPQEK